MADAPLRGHAVTVVAEADGLRRAAMQNFAAWNRTALTVFLSTPWNEADVAAQMFTPQREIAASGDALLAVAAAWALAGPPAREKNLLQVSVQGKIVPVDMQGAVPAFAAPPARIAPLPDRSRARLLAALGLPASAVSDAALVDNGPLWQMLALGSVADLPRRLPDVPREAAGLVLVCATPGGDGALDVRRTGAAEGAGGGAGDPLSGLLHAAVAQWQAARGLLPDPLTLRETRADGRCCRSTVSRAGARLMVGGAAAVVATGSVWL